MRTKARLPGLGLAFSTLFGGMALLAAVPALADPAAQSEAGLLRLPNVRFQAATPLQIQQAARLDGRITAGMRAYIDPESNELRDQFPEEMHFTPEAVSKRARAKGSFAKSSLALPGGGVGMEVDEDAMSYSVVSRDSLGKIHMQCVTGEKAALSAMRKPVKEDRHDH
jgi:hypothetical protein